MSSERLRWGRWVGLGSGVLVLALSTGGQAWSAGQVPDVGEFAAAGSARSVSLVFLRQGFVIPNPVDLHFGSVATHLDGGPGYSAIADPVDPGFAKRAGGLAATVGVPVAIPDWPLGVELESGGKGGASRPVSVVSPDGAVSVDAIPARATASQGPETRVDADAAVQSVRIGMPTKRPAQPGQSQPMSTPNAVAAAVWKASSVLKGLAARVGGTVDGKDHRPAEEGILLSLETAEAKSGAGWVAARLEATAAAQVSSTKLLDGTIQFDGVRSSAITRMGLDGRPSGEESVEVAGARVADIPVTIDAGGVHVDKQAVGDGAVRGLQDALNGALKQAGVRIGLTGRETEEGTTRAMGLEVAVQVVNEQFRENNELAFRLATVETSSALNPESLVGSADEPQSVDSDRSSVPASPPVTPGKGGGTNAPGATGIVEHVPQGWTGLSGSSASIPTNVAPDAPGVSSSDVSGSPAAPGPSVGGWPTTTERRVEFAQPAAAHGHSEDRAAYPFSKGEASVLLVALAGQAAFVALAALRKSFS